MCTYILYRILGNYRVLDTIMSVNKSVKYLTSVSSKVFFRCLQIKGKYPLLQIVLSHFHNNLGNSN